MRKLSDTIVRLSALRNRVSQPNQTAVTNRLTPFRGGGTNPGDLDAYVYVPAVLGENAPLVVVLHGCTQTAAGYDHGAGWSQMADRYGFVVLFPEQRRQNNPNLCFNWFNPVDSRRGSGEPESIREMIDAVAATYGIDERRIFITGLSAGGAMASVMLATYPELFAGGAIIAGLPYGCASTVPQAFDRMRGHGMPAERELAALVRDASDHSGPWPTISIWHGTGDATVNPINADAIISQWRSLHEVRVAPDRQELVNGHPRRIWRNAAGRDVIEEYRITGMGHGTPLDTRSDDSCGVEGAYMLEVSISSTRHICRFWNLAQQVDAGDRGSVSDGPLPVAQSPSPPTVTAKEKTGSPAAAAWADSRKLPAAEGVGKVIEDALRTAGLMR